MRYKSFRIRNFKGIKDTTVNLETLSGANVFAFVGLNESGKTTILEAIYSFSPDFDTSELQQIRDYDKRAKISSWVPRHQLSSFNDVVSVTASISVDKEDVKEITSILLSEFRLILNKEGFPSTISFQRSHKFEGGDFKGSFFTFETSIKVKPVGERKWRNLEGQERLTVRDAIFRLCPDICYFPTFVFQFPERIYLTNDKRGELNNFYRDVFQDILDCDGGKFTIENDITRRVRADPFKVSWLDFLNVWRKDLAAPKIQHVIDRASATVTRLVLGRWNRIFGEDVKGREVIIDYDVIEGEEKDAKGNITKTNNHDVFIKFMIKDGTRRFNVNDRSLGFRWFFSFMLFTQFRAARNATRPLLFLFDEPASNLHAAAQQKLIECFPSISEGPHTLIYTTHSHYMIEPKWLEQTYIVTNRADAPPTSVLEAASLDDESLDVRATTYRKFVDIFPSQTSYFQPILDRLEVVPSKFDIRNASIVLEGRSDYYFLRYASAMHNKEDLKFLPGLGAGTFGALVALHIGWNLRCLFILDSDRQGRIERERYVAEFGLPGDRAVLLSDLESSLTTIESAIDSEAEQKILAAIGASPPLNKNGIRRFFQESLARQNIIDLGNHFYKTTGKLLTAISARI